MLSLLASKVQILTLTNPVPLSHTKQGYEEKARVSLEKVVHSTHCASIQHTILASDISTQGFLNETKGSEREIQIEIIFERSLVTVPASPNLL